MPMQEFLASYAVQVDEDGARRLQAILDQNRDSAKDLAASFAAADAALTALKKNLSDAAGLKNILSALNSGISGAGGSSGSNSSSGARGSASPGLSGRSLPGLPASLSGGSALLSVGANFSAAEKSLETFRTRMETERPRLSVNTTGITSAVSSAIATVRAMLSSVMVTIPVRAVPTLDTSGLNGGTGGSGSGSGSPRYRSSHIDLSAFGTGGRVESPTLAMIAENGEPEYVIPTDDEHRAVALMRSLLSEMSERARSALLKDYVSTDSKGEAYADLEMYGIPEAFGSELSEFRNRLTESDFLTRNHDEVRPDSGSFRSFIRSVLPKAKKSESTPLNLRSDLPDRKDDDSPLSDLCFALSDNGNMISLPQPDQFYRVLQPVENHSSGREEDSILQALDDLLKDYHSGESSLPETMNASFQHILAGFQEEHNSAFYTSSVYSRLRDVLSQLNPESATSDSLNVLPKQSDLISGLKTVLTDPPGPTGEESRQNELFRNSNLPGILSGLSQSFSHMADFSLPGPSFSQTASNRSDLPGLISLQSLKEFLPGLTASMSDLPALTDPLFHFDPQEFVSGFSTFFPEQPDFSKAVTLSGLQELLSGLTVPMSGLDDLPAQYFASELKDSLTGLSASVVRLSDHPNLFPESDVGNLLSGLTSSVSGLSDLPAMASAVDLPSLLSDLTGAVRASFLPADVRGGKTIPSVQAPINIHVTSHAASPEAVASSIYDTAQRSLLKTLESVFV